VDGLPKLAEGEKFYASFTHNLLAAIFRPDCERQVNKRQDILGALKKVSLSDSDSEVKESAKGTLEKLQRIARVCPALGEVL
jgi:hypothetical protein